MNASAWQIVRAVRGPVLLITFGTLMALNHMDTLDFERTWPILIIVYGRFQAVGANDGRPAPVPPPWPQPGYTPPYSAAYQAAHRHQQRNTRKEAPNEPRFDCWTHHSDPDRGLFLANNLRPDIPMLEFLGRFWPFLLIAWGAVRLVEILIWTVAR